MCSALLPVTAMNDQSQGVLQSSNPNHMQHLIPGLGTRFSAVVT